MILEPGEDKLRQNWYSDEYFLGVAKGEIRTQDQAWDYFRQSIFVDYESDNYNLYVQFSDDPGYSFGRMGVDLEKMFGKQYLIISPPSPPPAPLLQPPTTSSVQSPQSYWLIHKYLKSASRTPVPDGRNAFGLGAAGSPQQSRNIRPSHAGAGSSRALSGSAGSTRVGDGTEGLAILETFVILGKWVYKASTLGDLLGGKLTTATNLISSSLDLLRLQAVRHRTASFLHSPSIGFQRERVWCSEPMGALPGDAGDKGKEVDVGVGAGNGPASEVDGSIVTMEVPVQGQQDPPISTDDFDVDPQLPGSKRKRPPSSSHTTNAKRTARDQLGSDLAIRNAIASTRLGLGAMLAEREASRSRVMDN